MPHYRTRREAVANGVNWDSFMGGKAKAREKRSKPSHTAGRMNKTESRYAEVLEARRLAGEIRSWEFEAEELTLSDLEGVKCSYLPDFRVTHLDGSISYHEVKGKHIWDDSKIKLKWAATKYAPTPFYLCRWEGGRWRVLKIGS